MSFIAEKILRCHDFQMKSLFLKQAQRPNYCSLAQRKQ